ncbi:MAG: hypothetical protein ACU85V_08320 [Gammaproteobacteria bacterium]
MLALVLVLAGAAPASLAQQQMSAEHMQQALARAQGLLRQVAQQKAALEAEIAGMRVEQAGLKKKLRATERKLEERDDELASSQGREQQTSARLDRTEERLEATRGQLEEVIGKYRELAALQRKTTAERDQLAATLETTELTLRDAQARNRSLYDIGQELLELYEGKSAWDGLLQQERVSGLRKVELQNRLQDIEYRMYDELTDENLPAIRDAQAAAAAGDPGAEAAASD